MTGRWRSLGTQARAAVLAAALFAAAVTAAIITWWGAGVTQYFVQNVLPPSLWTLVGIALAHARQMAAHREAALAADGHRAVAAAARAEARTARTIMADLYTHQTGLHHPAAPRDGT